MRVTPRQLLISSAACIAAFTAVLLAVYHTGPGRWLDDTALNGFFYARTPERWLLADRIAHLCDPGPYVVIGAAIVGYCLYARGPFRAAAVTTLLIGTAVSSQVLKETLAMVRFEGVYMGPTPIQAAAFPSGHATAAMALALALVMVAPRRWRPLAVVVAAPFAVAVGLAVVLMGWHLPSDVIGGYLLAATWCFALLAVLKMAEARWPGRDRDARHQEAAESSTGALRTLVTVGTITVAIGIGIGAVVSRLDGLTAFAAAHTAATAVAMGISLAAAAVVTAVAVLTSQHR